MTICKNCSGPSWEYVELQTQIFCAIVSNSFFAKDSFEKQGELFVEALKVSELVLERIINGESDDDTDRH